MESKTEKNSNFVWFIFVATTAIILPGQVYGCGISGGYCLTCVSGSNNCSTCYPTYGLNPATGYCSICGNNCTYCASAKGTQGFCTQCSYTDDILGPDFGVATAACAPCSSNCSSCDNAGAGYCDQCDPGFGLTQCNKCAACDPNCAGGCTLAGMCDTFCADGYQLDTSSNTCGTCLPNCLQCTKPNTCDFCNDGYAKAVDGSCAPCAKNCAFCSTPGTCNTCLPTAKIVSFVTCYKKP